MTDFEYRGKKKDDGKWVYDHGFFADNAAAGNPVFVYSDVDSKWHEVIPETVGRYTGFIAGEKIYEGDVCSYQFIASDEKIGEIKWKEGRWIAGDIGSLYCVVQYLKIIGNIHDNPKLLEEVQN